MKLYTKEQVKIMLNRARLHKQDDTEMFTNEYLLSEETPIELPSDEKIDKIAEKTLGVSMNGFRLGAKWMKEQILKPNYKNEEN